MALHGEEHVNNHDDEVDLEEVEQGVSGSEAGEQHTLDAGHEEQLPQHHEGETQPQPPPPRPFRIEPISGATLYELERKRVETAARRGVLSTGCKEVDEQVLLGGGFERGFVFGVSCEDVEFGVSLSIQTLARSLVYNETSRAAIITTLPASAILAPLRNAVIAQINEKHVGHDGMATLSRQETNVQLRGCLERVSISIVFDVVGLWQVLDELEASSRANARRENERREEAEPSDAITGDGAPKVKTPREEDIAATSLPSLRPEVPRMEVADSEDEDYGEALSSSDSLNDATEERPTKQQTPPPDDEQLDKERKGPRIPTDDTAANSGMPDMILITHFSTLLSALFTQSGHDRTTAHTTLQLLSSHLRYLARSSGSVIMLLNTTTSYVSSTGSTNTNDTTTIPEVQRDGHPVEVTPQRPPSSNKPIDPSLRSIFNPAPIPGTNNGAAGNMLSRKNKPSFGLTFTQFLDVHLLCTRIPRTKDDAEHIYAAASRNEGGSSTEELKARFSARYCWIVEVLLDELGVWVAGSLAAGKEKRREDREQRWGVVQIRAVDGVVEDALGVVAGAEQRRLAELVDQGPFRLAAGFGGRRV